MATLYIGEFASLDHAHGIGVAAQVAAQPPLAEQTVTLATSIATASSAFNQGTRLVRLHNDGVGPCSVTFGTAPTATTSKARMAANQTEYFTVPQGGAYKVSGIINT